MMRNELNEYWADLSFIETNVHVTVMSDGGWMWALAWMQMGVQQVHCIPMGKQAERNLDGLRTHPHFVTRIGTKNNGVVEDKDTISILCLHFSSLDQLAQQNQSIQQVVHHTNHHACYVSIPPVRALQSMAKNVLGESFRWTTLKHHTLGGLTAARLLIGWQGLPTEWRPVCKHYPVRPLSRFLEPAVRLAAWRRAKVGLVDCWYPHADDAKPYPWPFNDAPVWVETSTVFFDFIIQRKLTVKERCQLIDLRQDWSGALEEIWQWDSGSVPPIRLYVEFIMTTTSWMQEKGLGEEGGKPKSNTEDWGRKRAPWLGLTEHAAEHEQKERILYFGWIWEPSQLMNVSVACKGDDAEVNLGLWAVGGDGPGMEAARKALRHFLWGLWARRLYLEATEWLRRHPEEVNREAIVDCLLRCGQSDWWNWTQGSRLLFWRWPDLWFAEARDGAPGFHTKQPRPRLTFPQVPIAEDWIVQKDKEKLEKLLRRQYIVQGYCRLTVPRFPVPKGPDDIRVVWDLAKNGVNDTMYTPSFFLATMATYIRRVDVGFFGGDFDIGEQFHNYMLHPTEQPNCGVEIPTELLQKLRKEGLQVDKYMRWNRLVFGWQSSPYMALRMLARAIEIAKGKPDEIGNPFRWEKLLLNLPGSASYNPRHPRVRRMNELGEEAADIVSFYDDGRVFGPTEESTHQALRRITAHLQRLGNQDAARKRRKISQRPGAWAGGIAYTDQATLRVFVSQEKWDKAKSFLDWVKSTMDRSAGTIERKQFQSGKGFLVYMSTCYEFIQPYLKGFHLSEDAWRQGRDNEGWKCPNGASDEEGPDDDDTPFEVYETPDVSNKTQAPPYITPVPRLRNDVIALQQFFQGETPVQILPRPVAGASFIAYGGGDASGEGYGGKLLPLGMKPLIRRGFWCPTTADESSNWRELRNIIDTIQEEAKVGRLVGREVWMATDNATAANAYYRGTSTSKKLHDMITELRLLTIRGNFILHLYHIPGTRMIASGIDGLSRGEMHVSSLTKALQTLLPLDQTPLERSPILLQWISRWLDSPFQVSTPAQWFYEAQQSGQYAKGQGSETWVWDLPPAAAIHALEELGGARLKRHDILRGVVIIPTLLKPEWGRRFARIVDIHFTVPAGAIPEWPESMHESLTIGLYFPLLRHNPWDWKRVPFMVPFAIAMSSMYKTDHVEAGGLLRKFWRACSGAATMPQRLVSRLLLCTSWRRFLSLPDER